MGCPAAAAILAAGLAAFGAACGGSGKSGSSSGSQKTTTAVTTHVTGKPVTTTATGASGGASSAAVAAGKHVFLTAGCATCHTLKAADSHGTVGPNLDQVQPDQPTVIHIVTNGFNGPGTAMPAFGGQLSSAKIKDVAAFVAASTHTKP